MIMKAKPLTDEEIENLAAYLEVAEYEESDTFITWEEDMRTH